MKDTWYSRFHLTTDMYYSEGQTDRRRPQTDEENFKLLWWPNDTRDICDVNPDICLTVEKKNPGKDLNQEFDPTPDRTLARWVRGNDVTPRPQRLSKWRK